MIFLIYIFLLFHFQFPTQCQTLIIHERRKFVKYVFIIFHFKCVGTFGEFVLQS